MDHHHRDGGHRNVDPEDVPPGVQRPHHGNAVQRAQHAAEFLCRADTAQHGGASARRPEVGGQCEGDGQQGTARDAQDGAADDQGGQVAGQGGDHRSEHESEQTALQDQLAAEPVRCLAQQRHGRDITQQVARDDRRDLLDLVNRDADITHDVGHDRDDDVGVEGTQGDREATGTDRQAAVGARRTRGPVAGRRRHQLPGFVTVTALPQSVSVMVMVLPADGSIWTWAS